MYGIEGAWLFIVYVNFICAHFQAKKLLFNEINSFVHEKILLAGKAISEFAQNKIKDGDVIMVYAWYAIGKSSNVIIMFCIRAENLGPYIA